MRQVAAESENVHVAGSVRSTDSGWARILYVSVTYVYTFCVVVGGGGDACRCGRAMMRARVSFAMTTSCTCRRDRTTAWRTYGRRLSRYRGKLSIQGDGPRRYDKNARAAAAKTTSGRDNTNAGTAEWRGRHFFYPLYAHISNLDRYLYNIYLDGIRIPHTRADQATDIDHATCRNFVRYPPITLFYRELLSQKKISDNTGTDNTYCNSSTEFQKKIVVFRI